jgi:dipeptidyl-peptidase-4
VTHSSPSVLLCPHGLLLLPQAICSHPRLQTRCHPLPHPPPHFLTHTSPAGAPKNIVCSPDGRRIAFVRSPPPLSSSFSAVNSLWVLDISPDASASPVSDRLVFDPAALPPQTSQMSTAELARRERMRESTSGATTFSTDARVEHAVFAVRCAAML